MKLGDTFLNRETPHTKRHLWIVVSCPERDPARIVLVNLTTVYPHTPPSDIECRVEPGDHPFVAHSSYVAFAQARVETLERLEAATKAGGLSPHVAVSEELLERVQQALLESRHAPLKCGEVLLEQGHE